jgi:hypothetical protein
MAWPASADTVAAFLAAQAGLGKRASTLSRRIAAIKYGHKLAGLPSPTDDEKIKATLSGICRSIGTAAGRKKAAVAEIGAAIASNTERLRQTRNRALFLIGFAGEIPGSFRHTHRLQTGPRERGPASYNTSRNSKFGSIASAPSI